MASLATDWITSVEQFMNDNADHRTKDWPFIQNPSILIVLTTAYLYFVCVYGPKFMKDRKPYSLKKTITVYNIGQIAACVYLFHGILNAGWIDEYSLGCQPVDRSLSPKACRMARFVWWTMILKVTEFAETIFFVLRKKYNQVSALHLYHHVSTLGISWMCCKFTPGGMATLPILVNSLVHIIMYTYYLIALHGGREMQMKLQNLKKSITVIQMIQFAIIGSHSLIGIRSDCNIPNFITYVFAPNIFILFYMFYKFYQDAYKKIK